MQNEKMKNIDLQPVSEVCVLSMTPAHKCVLVQDFLKEEKVVQHLSSTLFARP